MEDQKEESDDGYDSDLFENPDKASEFKCPICTCIAKDPIETEPCGHLYCKGCLQSHLNVKSASDLNDVNQNETQSECPTCREPIQETSRSKFVERQILKLRVKCANFNIGCSWKGELKYFKPHLRKECPFVTVTCAYCDTKPYMRGKEEQHLNECSEYPVDCKLCESQIKRKQFKEHTEKMCPSLLILCPNACGNKIKQSQLNKHLDEECIHRQIQCLYRCYGCIETPKYRDLQLHLSQHQVLHLELKVMYLERLAQSTELLSISNTTGLFPEISGLYEREQEPYLARPAYRSKNKSTYLVRYDDVLKGWVLDRSEFEGDVVALRYGKFPTATAKKADPKHVLDLEQTLSGKHVQINAIHAVHKEHKEDEKQSQEANVAINNIAPKLNDTNVRKSGVFSDGLWHVKGNLTNSRIRVRGYTQREFDLEWEFSSLCARMRRQRSGMQQVTTSGANTQTNNAIGCICGTRMVKKKENVYKMMMNKDWNAICNVCGNTVLSGIDFMHCPSKRVMQHLDGYDLCLSCAEARKQTQHLSSPTCECGSKLVAMMSFNAYHHATRVSCNVCSVAVDGAIWHCAKNYNKTHERGFDLCVSCGKTYSAKKAGLMSWWTGRQ